MALEELAKPRGHTFLALRAPRPCAFVLWIVQPRQTGAHASKTDPVPRRSRALLALSAPSFVLAASACASSAALERLAARKLHLGGASFACDGPCGALMESAVALHQLATAVATATGIPKGDPAIV
jgi:hypothetical protein